MRHLFPVLLMAIACTAFSQEVKYDEAVISYYLGKHTLYISVNGKEFTENPDTTLYGNSDSQNPFIAKVQEFENKGWLCTNIITRPLSNGSHAYLAYLKRKKEEEK